MMQHRRGRAQATGQQPVRCSIHYARAYMRIMRADTFCAFCRIPASSCGMASRNWNSEFHYIPLAQKIENSQNLKFKIFNFVPNFFLKNKQTEIL